MSISNSKCHDSKCYARSIAFYFPVCNVEIFVNRCVDCNHEIDNLLWDNHRLISGGSGSSCHRLLSRTLNVSSVLSSYHLNPFPTNVTMRYWCGQLSSNTVWPSRGIWSMHLIQSIFNTPFNIWVNTCTLVYFTVYEYFLAGGLPVSSSFCHIDFEKSIPRNEILY